MYSRLRKFFALTASDKRLFVRAWFLLGRYRAATRLRPFKALAGHLQHHAEQPVPASLSAAQAVEAEAIGRLVARAANTTPWQSPCLAQVLVVQRLLEQRGIPGQFYLGVKRGGAATPDPAALAAHAWLQCGDRIVSGAQICHEFAVVSTYSWAAAPSHEAHR